MRRSPDWLPNKHAPLESNQALSSWGEIQNRPLAPKKSLPRCLFLAPPKVASLGPLGPPLGPRINEICPLFLSTRPVENGATNDASALDRAMPACDARRAPQSLPPSPAMPGGNANVKRSFICRFTLDMCVCACVYIYIAAIYVCMCSSSSRSSSSSSSIFYSLLVACE